MQDRVSVIEGDGVIVNVVLKDTQFDVVTEKVAECEAVDEIVNDGECVPDTDCESDCVPHGDAVKEIDAVPQALSEADSVDIEETDVLTDPQLRLVTDGLNDADPVNEFVGDEECVPDPDCDIERVPQGETVKETDAVPHELGVGERDDVNELDGLTVPLTQLVADEQKDTDTVGEDDNVAEMDDVTEGVPDPD